MSQCRFPADDWQKVLDYCRIRFKGGKIHKAKRPISDSTYEQFVDWIENGYGCGDYVAYGRTKGVVGDSTPDVFELIAYCDYEGRLIVQKLPNIDKSRLRPLAEEQKMELKKILFDNSIRCNVENAVMSKMNTPKKYSYVIIKDGNGRVTSIGMWLESNGCETHFAALFENNTLHLDYWKQTDYTPFEFASNTDIKRLHQAISKEGYIFSERMKQFVKAPERGGCNVYWYLNDRFRLEMDRDDGSSRHTERFKVGNYFIDQTLGVLFMDDVKKRAEQR